MLIIPRTPPAANAAPATASVWQFRRSDDQHRDPLDEFMRKVECGWTDRPTTARSSVIETTDLSINRQRPRSSRFKTHHPAGGQSKTLTRNPELDLPQSGQLRDRTPHIKKRLQAHPRFTCASREQGVLAEPGRAVVRRTHAEDAHARRSPLRLRLSHSRTLARGSGPGSPKGTDISGIFT